MKAVMMKCAAAWAIRHRIRRKVKERVTMRLIASCLAITACFAGASAASAGTGTASGTATLNVVNQCTVTGGNISLGTFRTTDTMQTVANQIGYQDGTTFENVPGTKGIGTVSLGSVTCDTGTPYTIAMRGSGWASTVNIQMPTGVIELYLMVKKIGDYDVPDGNAFINGFGKQASPDLWGSYTDQTPLGTTANGASQQIMGSTIMWLQPTSSDGYIGADEQLGTAGVYTGSWVTTLNF